MLGDWQQDGQMLNGRATVTCVFAAQLAIWGPHRCSGGLTACWMLYSRQSHLVQPTYNKSFVNVHTLLVCAFPYEAELLIASFICRLLFITQSVRFLTRKWKIWHTYNNNNNKILFWKKMVSRLNIAKNPYNVYYKGFYWHLCTIILAQHFFYVSHENV